MSVDKITEALKRAGIEYQRRRLENAYSEFMQAEELAHTIVEDLGDNAPEVAINAYFIDTAIGIADVLVLLERDFEGALERYLRVKSYPLARNPIDAETLWLKLVRCSLAEGDAAFRRDDRDSAKEAYARVLDRSDGTDRPPTNALYSGMLSIMPPKVGFWIGSPPDDIAEADTRDYPPELLAAFTDTRQRLENLENGLNYLGYPDDYAPIFSFGRLQEIARGFAKFAAQANREYLNFTRIAESETQTIRQFEQAVNLNRAGIAIELSREAVVEREIEAAEQSLTVARRRAQRAQRASNRFSTTGWELARLQQAQAWAGAAAVSKDDEIRQSYRGLEDLGISSNSVRRSELTNTIAWEQARRSYSLEAARYRDAAAELQDAVTLSRRQFSAARARRNAAQQSVRSARWRHRASLENLKAAQSRVVSADLLFEFASLARQTAQIYLDRAVEAAFLMQQAFNLEYNTRVDRIRLDYGDLTVLDGLYAADFLLRDIDEFTLQSVSGIQNKLQSSVQILSLRRHFPFALFELIRSGETQFETTLFDFHGDLPGTYDGRIKRVRVLVQATSGPDGVAGMLSCSGTSLVRQVDGSSLRKVHSTETLILPRASVQTEIDSPLTGANGQLEVFENVGVATSWSLQLPPQWNAIDLKAITDVKIVVAYWFRHSDALQQRDLDNLPDTEEGELLFDITQAGPNLRHWRDLESGARTTIALNDALLPPHHRRDATLKRLAIIVVRPDAEVQLVTLRLRAADSGMSGEFTSSADGIVVVASEEVPGDFAGIPLMQDYELELPSARNPDLGPGPGSDLSGVYLIQFAFEYEYSLAT